MRPIPPKLKKEILADPYYKICAMAGMEGHTCGGRITFDHTIIYASKQLNKRWAIVPICARGHSVDKFQDNGELDRQKIVWIALNRATNEELLEISKVIPYMRERVRLNAIYGTYKEPVFPMGG